MSVSSVLLKILSTVSPVGAGTWQCPLDYPSPSEDLPDSRSENWKNYFHSAVVNQRAGSYLSLQNTDFSIFDIQVISELVHL